MGVGGPIGVGSSSAAPTRMEERPAEVAGGGGAAGGGGRSHGLVRAAGIRRRSPVGEEELRAAAGAYTGLCGRGQAQVQAAAGAGVCSGGG